MLSSLELRSHIHGGKEADPRGVVGVSQVKKELCEDNHHREIANWGGTTTLQSERLKKLISFINGSHLREEKVCAESDKPAFMGSVDLMSCYSCVLPKPKYSPDISKRKSSVQNSKNSHIIYPVNVS